MTDWTWPEWTIAVLAFGGIGYLTHRARGIGERAKRRESRVRQWLHSHDRGEEQP